MFFRLRWWHGLILAVMGYQIITHVVWLSLSTQSGQVTVPWLMNRGYTLFGNLIEQRAPLSAVILALAQRIIPLEPVEVVRWLNIALVLLFDGLIFVLARRFSGGQVIAGAAALLVWAWWEPVFGNTLFYFDTLLGLMVVVSLIVILPRSPTPSPHSREGSLSSPLYAVERGTGGGVIFLAGICLGLGVLFKQHGWGCIGAMGLWLLLFQPGQRIRSVGFYTAGVALPVLIVATIIAIQGNLETYLYWNYAVNFEGKITPAIITGDFIRRLMLVNLFVLPFVFIIWHEARNPVDSGLQEGRTWPAMSLKAHSHFGRGMLLLLVWAGAWLPLVPHGGDVHAMTFLPLTAVMSGVVMGRLAEFRAWYSRIWHAMSLQLHQNEQAPLPAMRSEVASPVELTLAGILALMALIWAFTGIAPQLSAPLGRGAVIAYGEFLPVAEVIKARARPGDRLFVLPQFDGSPQLLVETGLLPPGTWTNHDGVFLQARDNLMVRTMLAELEAAPPRFIVYFPELTYVRDVRPAIEPLIAFIKTQPYTEMARFPAIPFNGEAIVYEYQGD